MKTQALPLDAPRRRWYEAACERLDLARVKQLVIDLTARHSPTGGEREAAQFMADYLNRVGIDARYQPVTERSGNCYGRVRGAGDGPTLMLYAPIDTLLEGDAEKDLPHAGPALRADMVPDPRIEGDLVIGLGASNPKSMLALLTEALTCVVEAGVELRGDAIIATAGGGMPWRVPERDHAGLSSGVSHLLSQGVTADFGVICKPWDEVYYEHPGLVWFKVTVWGAMGYAGIPRGTPEFRSSIIPAARLILELEEWLKAYPDRHASEQVKPEGWIAALRCGWPDKPAFPGAATEIYLDVRTSPLQKAAEVEREFAQVMGAILAKHEGLKAEWETLATCDAAATDPTHWIVQSALRAWEEVHGRPYAGAPPMAGQTDAAFINRAGFPLVRIGYPWVGEKDLPAEFAEGLGGMGVACIPDLEGPIKQAIYMVIDSCTRPRGETL